MRSPERPDPTKFTGADVTDDGVVLQVPNTRVARLIQMGIAAERAERRRKQRRQEQRRARRRNRSN